VSIDLTVYLRRSAMPTPSAWQQAIAATGLPVELDTDFDPDTFTGYLPCKLRGVDAGFEYFSDSLSPEDAASLDAPPGVDYSVNLVVHSDPRELASAVVAAAALASASGGLLVDPQSGESYPAAEALSWAATQFADAVGRGTPTASVGERGQPSHTAKTLLKSILLGIGITLALAAAMFCLTAWYALPLGPFLDDGPFHGVPTQAVDSRSPDHSMPIWDGNVLEVFDSTEQGVSATVQLRRDDGSVAWAILADGHEPGDARSVRFSSASRGLARSGSVYGVVDWTYGSEATNWYITGGGQLRDYWYSW
jgi:hypothetical protein